MDSCSSSLSSRRVISITIGKPLHDFHPIEAKIATQTQTWNRVRTPRAGLLVDPTLWNFKACREFFRGQNVFRSESARHRCGETLAQSECRAQVEVPLLCSSCRLLIVPERNSFACDLVHTLHRDENAPPDPNSRNDLQSHIFVQPFEGKCSADAPPPGRTQPDVASRC